MGAAGLTVVDFYSDLITNHLYSDAEELPAVHHARDGAGERDRPYPPGHAVLDEVKTDNMRLVCLGAGQLQEIIVLSIAGAQSKRDCHSVDHSSVAYELKIPVVTESFLAWQCNARAFHEESSIRISPARGHFPLLHSPAGPYGHERFCTLDVSLEGNITSEIIAD